MYTSQTEVGELILHSTLLNSSQSMHKEGKLDSIASPRINLLSVPLVDIFADIRATIGVLSRNPLDWIGFGHFGRSEMG